MSSHELEKFLEILGTVMEAREDMVHRTGWDNALMEQAKQNRGAGKSGFTDTMAEPGKAVATKKKFCMPYIRRNMKNVTNMTDI